MNGEMDNLALQVILVSNASGVITLSGMINLQKYKKIGNFTLSSGRKSKYYYDVKEAMGEPSNLQKIFAKLMQEIPITTDLFVGIEYGGIPLAIICSVMTGKPYAVLRKNKKRHGTLSKIEGFKGKGRVVLLDDVYTTGNSIKKATRFLTKKGYNVVKTLTVIDRSKPDGEG